MLWKIAKKEFLLNLMTFKFAVGTIVCVVLTAVFMPVLVSDYQDRLKQYNDAVSANEAELRKVKVYKNITPTIYRCPNVLSVFSEGLEKRLGYSAKIELDNIPELSAVSTGLNPYLSIYPVLDVSLVFKIVMSVLALLVAYDVIAGERERGTLKLVLSGTVARYQVLAGKFLAGLATLVIPITMAFIVGVLIFEFFPLVDLAGSDWVRIGLMYLGSLIFLSAMYNVGLLLSCLTKRSTISLVLGLFFWIVYVIVIPNGSGYLARKIQPLEPEEKLESELELVAEKRDSELRRMNKELPSGRAESHAGDAFNRNYIFVCDKRSLEYWKKSSVLKEPVKIKYADKFLEVKQKHLSNLFKQKYLANNFSRTSPISLFENIMSALAGTDLARAQYFMDRVRMHRNNVVDYIRSKTADFSSLSYFTRSKEGDWEESRKMLGPSRVATNEAVRKRVLDAFYKWRDKKIAETPALDLPDFPQFIYQPSVARSFSRAIPDLALLAFISVLFFVLSFVAFMRYDVRSD
jgi:ABC-type transport system involved in multi-copper enzyme maturation permease subunit